MKRLFSAVLILAAIVFLVWFTAPLFFGVFHIGNLLGICICLTLIFRFGFAQKYKRLKYAMCRCLPTKLLVRCVQIMVSVFSIYAVIISGFMVYAMNIHPSGNETAVVLGAQVMPDGRPCVLLQQRIDAAREYLETNPAATAVLTGSQGNNEPMSEAQSMYDTLCAAGIAPERLYRETFATNTEQNIRYSVKMITDNGLEPNLAVVSDSYHQLRARIIAGKTDSNIQISAVNTHNNYIGLSAYPSYFVREWIAIPAEILK